MTGSVHTPREQLGQFIPLHYHTHMLADGNRMAAFKEAIETIVQPGHRVVDLGGGTGVLSCWAAQRGADVIYVEANLELVEAAERLLKHNLGPRSITLAHTDALHYLPDEPADVVICEMLHSGLLREKQLQILDSFRARHQERFGTLPRFIPDATILAVQPVQQDFDFHGYQASIPLFQDSYVEQTKTIGLGQPVIYNFIEYHQQQSLLMRGEMIMQAHEDGKLNALRFVTKNLLAVLPEQGRSIDWHNQYLVLPLEKPVHVKNGDRVLIRFAYLAGAEINNLHQSILADKLPSGDVSLLFRGEEVRVPANTKRVHA